MSTLPLNQGVNENQYYSMDDIQNGDPSGSTDSDSMTDPNVNKNYTKINQKKGKNVKRQ